MIRILLVLVLAYGGLALVVFLNQRSMLYHPSRDSLEALTKLAASFGFRPWTNAASDVIGWMRPAPSKGPHPRVLIVHGNAGSAIDRVDYANGVTRVMPADVYILEYPGYGSRPGAPTQTSVLAAADDAIALIEKDGPVCIIGESLGTGVAAYLAGTHPKSVAAMLLMAPYHNMIEVAQSHMPIFPVRLMLLDQYPAAKNLRDYHGPVAVVLAGEDEVIPKRFGKHLYDDYKGPKRLWEISKAGHNDLPDQPAEWWQELVSFWKTNATASLTNQKASEARKL
jgi:pimeloyl-ACP methyl ester carboxylesterase